VKMQVKFFWVVMPASVVVEYQCHRGPYCHCLQGEVGWRQHGPLRCHPTMTLHGFTNQRNLNYADGTVNCAVEKIYISAVNVLYYNLLLSKIFKIFLPFLFIHLSDHQ